MKVYRVECCVYVCAETPDEALENVGVGLSCNYDLSAEKFDNAQGDPRGSVRVELIPEGQ